MEIYKENDELKRAKAKIPSSTNRKCVNLSDKNKLQMTYVA